MTDNERAVVRQAQQDLADALKSAGTKWTDYSQSRVEAAKRQLEYLLRGQGIQP